jgi:hypothetical protein
MKARWQFPAALTDAGLLHEPIASRVQKTGA